ncbi:MAG: aspartate 1-decarboxylase [Oligoflexia bacterium]|nr:aspartate 1-decarboxylase [Oligoflexia bacterium]
MLLNLLKAKIHRARVTEANLNYEGSVTIDQNILAASGIRPHEQVHICNIDNGERFVTYVIEGKPNSGVICLNGAAARLVSPGDKVIIISYGQYTEEEAREHRPKVVLIDDDSKDNKIKDAYCLKPGTPINPGEPLVHD